MEYYFNFEKLEYVSSKKDDGCIFCGIVKRIEETKLLVTLTNRFIVILNLYPYNPGHTMIIPKRHITDIRELTVNENAEFNDLRDYCINMIEEIYKPHGFNIGFNMGLPAGASITHLHLHIIPRYPNEIGIAELIGGKRVLVENPLDSCLKMKNWTENHPFSTRKT